MELRRVRRWSSFGETGWEQVQVLCLDHWLESGRKNLQDSIGWKLIGVDQDYFYLGRER